jgi:hypothetical protein
MPPMGPAKEVNLGKPESLNEGDGVCGHLLNTRRHLTRTARNTCVIEKNHLAVIGQAVGYGRIPVIHSPGVMRAEDERHAAVIAETAIGETDSIGLDELRRRGLMGEGGHDRSPNVGTQKSGCVAVSSLILPTPRPWQVSPQHLPRQTLTTIFPN